MVVAVVDAMAAVVATLATFTVMAKLIILKSVLRHNKFRV